MKQLLIETFGTPSQHPKSKPFCDHVLSFNVADDKIWFRNYQVMSLKKLFFHDIWFQIVYNREDKDLNDVEMIEIGPRFCLNLIKIFDGSLNGAVLYENPQFTNPNKVLKLNCFLWLVNLDKKR